MHDQVLLIVQDFQKAVVTECKLHLYLCRPVRRFSDVMECVNWLKLCEEYCPFEGLLIMDYGSIEKLSVDLLGLHKHFELMKKNGRILVLLSAGWTQQHVRGYLSKYSAFTIIIESRLRLLQVVFDHLHNK